MAIEIERKFLLRSTAWRALTESSTRLRDGLLSTGGQKVRIRISEASATLCVKLPKAGISRFEFEYTIPITDAVDLMAACVQPVIERTRHIVRNDGNVWEIDEYGGALAGLIIAEIELQNEFQKFSRPSWIGREVTGDARYRKENLLRIWQAGALGLDLGDRWGNCT